MSDQRFTIKQVAEQTGLEESEIRFYEKAFSQFLQFTRMESDSRYFNPDHVEVLQRIKDLIHKRSLSVEEVKRELKSALGAGGGESARFDGVPVIGDVPVQEMPQSMLTPYSRSVRKARVIAVTSGKGGVGKTTVSVNLAVSLARQGKKVALLDADFGLANCHILLGIKPRFNLRHVIEDGFKIEDLISTTPEGVQLISGSQGVREMANLTADQRRILLRQIDHLERTVDVLVVDTGAGISDNVLRFALMADEIITVATPNVSSAADAFSIIKILLEMDPNAKIGVLANGARDVYEAKNVFNRLNEAVKKHLQYALGDLGYICDDEHVRLANQQRVPLVRVYPHCDAAKQFQGIVRAILHGEVFVNRRKESSFQDVMGALRRTMAGAA